MNIHQFGTWRPIKGSGIEAQEFVLKEGDSIAEVIDNSVFSEDWIFWRVYNHTELGIEAKESGRLQGFSINQAKRDCEAYLNECLAKR